jgi:hypothetical protein
MGPHDYVGLTGPTRRGDLRVRRNTRGPRTPAGLTACAATHPRFRTPWE